MVPASNGSSPGAAPLLELRGIGVRFGGIAALSGIDLELRPGEVCGLIGPNGAGKTTLFDVVSGITAPTAGTVVLRGGDVSSWSPGRRARAGVRRTFQQVQVFGWLTVEDNVLAGLEWRGGGGGFVADMVRWPGRRRRERDRRARVAEALGLCGLDGVRDNPASALPTGLARMLELARATVDPPAVLLLDEPSSGLDAAEATRLAERVRAVRDEHGCAVLLVEHDVSFVMSLCDRVVVLDLGRVLTAGTPAEVRADRAVQDAYLGTGAATAGAA